MVRSAVGIGASGGDHQAERELRCSVGGAWAAACRVADRDSETRASRDVQHSVHSPRDADHAQLGKTAEQGFREGGPLTHGQKNVEIGERDGGLVLRSKSVGKKHELRPPSEPGPVGAGSRHVLPIIEDCNFHQLLLRVGG
jgi:hypothetical protein